MHELVAEYIDEQIQNKLEQRRNYYHTNEAFRKRCQVKELARWHARKKISQCELCGKGYLYLDRHRLSKKHLDKEANPASVIINQFEELKPVIAEVEKKQAEIDQIKASVSNGNVPRELIKPIQIVSKRSRKSIKDLLD
jgi:hypothetical protein